MNRWISIKILEMMMERYGFDTLISEFCDKVEVIESNDFYESIMQLISGENQQEKIMQCRNQFEYIDATIIMPQNTNRIAYILFKDDFGLEAIIRKTIHEFVHLLHRCAITKNMILNDLYAIEDNRDYKLYYYLDEFLAKKKELIIYYDLLHKNKKIVDENVYINTMIKAFEFAIDPSLDLLNFMRNELFAIAETLAYIYIFPNMFPKNFIEVYANISDINIIINILKNFNTIEVFQKNRYELKSVVDLLEKNYYTSHQN